MGREEKETTKIQIGYVMTREYLPELDYYFNQYWIDRGEMTPYQSK